MSVWVVVGVYIKTDQCMKTNMVGGGKVTIPDVETARQGLTSNV